MKGATMEFTEYALWDNWQWEELTPAVRDKLVTEGKIYYCPDEPDYCHVEPVYHINPEHDDERDEIIREIREARGDV